MNAMAAGINALIILAAMNLVKPQTTTTELTHLNEIIEQKEVNNNDLNEIIDKYEKDFTKIQSDLMSVKNNLETNRLYIKSALIKFKNALLNEDVFKKSNEPIDQFQCNNYGTHCGRRECPEHTLNKGKYNESIEVFSKLLFNEFDEKLIKFDHQLNNLLTDVLTSKMLIYVQYKLNNTNGEHLNDTDKWKEDIINSLEATKENTFEMAKELVIAFKTLNKNKEEFERYVLKKISEKKLKYACCLKSFDFDIDVDGLRCNPPAPVKEDDVPLSITQEDLRKFSLFKRNQ